MDNGWHALALWAFVVALSFVGGVVYGQYKAGKRP